ncbi:MAG: bifunctional diaminohydroxyphosphoribosylaminopyrimidine deaminase/5-amino-6-(5-phosphoribosylamino)uracil reductase RibD [Kiritimatiellia bacterium]
MQKYSPEDIRWMRRAVELARLSEGYTRPNPPVGAVVVKDGRLIGEGRHKYAGGDHAEVAALDSCTESPEGAVMYVTLEPCSTYGRTPPCTERIIRDKLRRVVIACEDCYEHHCGEGHRILKQAGLDVTSGVCAEDACEIAAPFFKHVDTGMPFVTLKLAMTLDGCIADYTGSSQWITGGDSRSEVQRLRRRADAVMVGARTVIADDPSLLCRSGGGENIMRVILDSDGVVPLSSKVLNDAAVERTIIFTSVGTPVPVIEDWRKKGCSVELMQPDVDGFPAIKDVFEKLGTMDMLHILCEGGGGVAAALHTAGLIDEYVLFYAPALMNDLSAVRGFAGRTGCTLQNMDRLTVRDVRRFGDDICVRLC